MPTISKVLNQVQGIRAHAVDRDILFDFLSELDRKIRMKYLPLYDSQVTNLVKGQTVYDLPPGVEYDDIRRVELRKIDTISGLLISPIDQLSVSSTGYKDAGNNQIELNFEPNWGELLYIAYLVPLPDYKNPDDLETDLVIGDGDEGLYRFYLLAEIALAEGDTDMYNNYVARFNEIFEGIIREEGENSTTPIYKLKGYK